ncbi:MAG: hypothetical protein Q8P06_02595 [Candidatus Azambacteria bacterium]|nr:hypothetical protein [Candidatus Azambacteria bacterium]
MKALIIIFGILGVFFLYFVATAEKPLVIKGGEVIPGGIDVSKTLLDSAKTIKSFIAGDKSVKVTGENLKAIGDSAIKNSAPTLINKIKNITEDIIFKTIEKAKEVVRDPIEKKIGEVICPVNQ